jgi:hypothetical protein
LVSVARRDEAVDVAGDEGAAVLHDDDVFAFAAAGFASVFVAFVLLKAKTNSYSFGYSNICKFVSYFI